MPKILRYFEEFAAEQIAPDGTPYPFLVDTGDELLFSNGAVSKSRCVGSNAFDHQEPPTDDKERLTLCRRFHDIKIRRIEWSFRNIKRLDASDCSWEWPKEFGDEPTSAGYHDSATALRHLVALRDQHKNAAEEIQRQIDNLPETKRKLEAREERAQMDAENERRKQARFDEIESITL